MSEGALPRERARPLVLALYYRILRHEKVEVVIGRDGLLERHVGHEHIDHLLPEGEIRLAPAGSQFHGRLEEDVIAPLPVRGILETHRADRCAEHVLTEEEAGDGLAPVLSILPQLVELALAGGQPN